MRIMASCRGRVDASVLLLSTEGADPEWEQTDARAALLAMPGIRVVSDPGGVEAGVFGAETSGKTLLFDGQGRLVFSGGITGSRGHEGDNPGEDAVIDWITRGTSDLRTSAVYGCSLKARRAPDRSR